MKNNKTLLLYPAGIAQREAFMEAKKQGLHIVTVDADEGAPMRELAHEFFHLNPADSAALLAFVRDYVAQSAIDGVLLVGCDLPVPYAQVADFLGRPALSEQAARLTVDKIGMKRAMSRAGVSVPEFYSVSAPEQLAEIMQSTSGRMILKPNDNCGARGIMQVFAGDDYRRCFDYAMRHSRGDKRLVLEKFVDGLQISIEALVLSGRVHVTGLADRNYEFLDRYAPHIIENGATMPTSLSHAEREATIAMFERAVFALGLDNCVVKGDMIFSPRGAVVVELAGRISGGKFASQLVPRANGVNLLAAAIRFAVGETVDFSALQPRYERGVAVRYLFTPAGVVREINGLAAASAIAGVVETVVVRKVGDSVGDICCHADRSGWVVAAADTRTDAVAIAERAVDAIDIVMA